MKPKYQIIHEFYGKTMRGRFCYTEDEAAELVAQIIEIYQQYNFEGTAYYVEV